MSLEAALDEERREIMEILEGRPRTAVRPTIPDRTASPVPVVRSMLDVSAPTPRHTSISSTNASATSPAHPSPTVRSMLDLTLPPPTERPQILSAVNSPTITNTPVSQQRHRSSSDAASTSGISPERYRKKNYGSGVDIDQQYQFEMMPSIANQALPKRVSQGGKLGPRSPTSMAAVMSGSELGPLPGYSGGRETWAHGTAASGKSHSPSSRVARSQSPGHNLLPKTKYNLMSTPGKYVTDDGKVIDMDHAYRRLSDAALLKSGGSLATYQKSTSRDRVASGVALSPTGEVRLAKDYYHDDPHTEDDALESSDEDPSSGDEDSVHPRGRQRNRGKKEYVQGDDSDEDEGKPRKPQSLLAAAESERLEVSSKYKVKSLLEPSLTVTTPSGEKVVPKKQGVHPKTNFDTASGFNTPNTSDNEAELSDVRRAQNMAMNLSPIYTSNAARSVRTILRGEYLKLEQEMKESNKRCRTYLVATDLSDEAVYALEWTIGTILRDGDTLLACYAVDEEMGIGKGVSTEPGGNSNNSNTNNEASSSVVQIGEGAKMMQETAALVGNLTEKMSADPPTSSSPSPLALLPATDIKGRADSVDGRLLTARDRERAKAVEEISNTCVRLLRKTRLVVRIAVEVIYCKSPKHMITEAIDEIEPTLVILGSRGRSALKGVLLGSFSNYLVTKSSVPVMVARKKLRKHAKYKSAQIRLSNNLTNPKRLAAAKVD